jgi:ankyrin repeat protein
VATKKVVDLLIQNGADIESLLGPWANPLQAAAKSGQLLAVWWLIAQGSAVNKPALYKGRMALHIACCKGNDVIVKYLINAGANVMA